MSDSTTIARPYAKAIFEYALAKHQLTQWSDYLSVLAHTVSDTYAAQFISNPASTSEQQVALLHATFMSKEHEYQPLSNLIHLLADNKRLLLLAEIYALYEIHRAEQEKTLSVDVISYSVLSSTQQQQLIDALSRRLQRNVSLNIDIDPSLLGGAVIRAGDLVIDGSVRGKLNKLSTDLAA